MSKRANQRRTFAETRLNAHAERGQCQIFLEIRRADKLNNISMNYVCTVCAVSA